KYSNILKWPVFGGSLITAGVMGVFRKFRYVLVTPALMKYLEPEEFDAVIAHEIGHIKRRHIFLYLLFLLGFSAISYSLFDLFRFVIIYFGLDDTLRTMSPLLRSILISFIPATLFIVYFRYIFGYFMRNCEREADIFVYSLMDSAKPMISTFNKIASINRMPKDKPSWHHFSI
ncbi:MAG: M48 family metalloprotease, partial [bacterium]|nr:M48 family metalloprotease [bacterium]